MAKPPSGLGRGLGALLGEEALQPENTGVTQLSLSMVQTNSSQPRKNFDEESLADLAESIRQHGILQPLVVRKLASGYYQIIAGERRWRAARMADLKEVPVVILEADDRTAAALAMIENLQREDLNPMEEAGGYRMLIDQFHMTQEEAASQVGKSRSAVANALRLLDLSEPVRAYVAAGDLTAGHARALIPLPAALQLRAADAVLAGGLSVRQTEALAKRLAAESAAKEQEPKKSEEDAADTVDYTDVAQRELASKLGRGVRIVTGRKKGRIELEYYGLDDLNELLDALALLQYREGEHA